MKKYIIIFISFWSVVQIQGQAQNFENPYTLNLTFLNQGDAGWCWAAAGNYMFKYYKPRDPLAFAPLCEYVTRTFYSWFNPWGIPMFEKGVCYSCCFDIYSQTCNQTLTSPSNMNSKCNAGYNPSIALKNFQFPLESSYKIDFNMMRKYLLENKILLMSMKNDVVGHAIVVVGFYNNNNGLIVKTWGTTEHSPIVNNNQIQLPGYNPFNIRYYAYVKSTPIDKKLTYTIIPTNPSSCNDDNGSITINMSNPNNLFDFHWERIYPNPQTFNNNTNNTISSLSSGYYEVRITPKDLGLGGYEITDMISTNGISNYFIKIENNTSMNFTYDFNNPNGSNSADLFCKDGSLMVKFNICINGGSGDYTSFIDGINTVNGKCVSFDVSRGKHNLSIMDNINNCYLGCVIDFTGNDFLINGNSSTLKNPFADNQLSVKLAAKKKGETNNCDEDVKYTLVATTTPANLKNLKFLWATPNGEIESNSNTIDATDPGLYIVTVSNGDLSCISSASSSTTIKKETVKCPQDPNEISGNLGYAEPQWVAQNEKLNYSIRYENDPDFATAPATRVKISIPINNKQDLRSFRLSDFGFGSHIFTVPQNTTNYYKRLDVKDDLGVWVDVTAGIDITKNEAFWIFQAIDPQTGIEPVSAQMGFLPVNDKDIGNGEGYVNFSILPATSTQTGDSILAQASVVFDDNAALETNTWSNVIDAGNPQSRLNGVEIPSDSLAAQFTFTAQDDKNGSGVKQVEVYVSENEGAYNLYAVSHPDSTITFYGASGSIYRFFSIAEDNVGNREPMKTEAEFSLNLNQAPTDILLSGNSFYQNDYMGSPVGYLTTIDDNPKNAYYTLVSGEGDTNNELFGIYGSQLMTNTDFNCSKDTIYNVRVRTTDIGGLWFEKAFELKMIITNVIDTTKIQKTICQGETFTLNEQELSATGTYYQTLSTVLGCDSIIQLTLTVYPVPEVPLVTITGTHTLVSSADTGNQWYDENGPVEGANAQSFTPDKNGIYYVTVSNEFCESEPSDKYQVDISDQALLLWDWKSGWYWISVNQTETVNPVTFFSPVKEYFVRLLSQTGELIYDPLYEFVGDITTFDPQSGYKLQMNGDVTKELSGTVASPANYIIPLRKGWNWIGYPALLNLDLPIALSKLNAETEDVIKSQTDFAIFNETSWVGTLTALSPGEGYMYYSDSNKPLEYSSVRVVKVTPGLKSALSVYEQPWEFNPHNYPNNMNMVSQLYSDGNITPENAYTVGAFSGDECRGIGKYVNGYLYITIHGANKGEPITFKAIENQTQKEDQIKESVSFDEIILGTLRQPYPLNLLKAPEGEGAASKEGFVIYPNPVSNRLYINGDISKIKKLQITDAVGKTVMKINDLTNNTLDVSHLSRGTYTVSLYTGMGIFNYKLLK